VGRRRKYSPELEAKIIAKFKLGRRLTPKALCARYGMSRATFANITSGNRVARKIRAALRATVAEPGETA
jgi:hypothetical protein